MKLSKEMNCYPVVIQDRAVRQVLTAKAFELEQENEKLKEEIKVLAKRCNLQSGEINQLRNQLAFRGDE